MSRKRARGRRDAPAAIEHLHGLHVIEEALLARRRPLHRLLVRRGPSRVELEPLVRQARRIDLPVEPVEAELLQRLSGEPEANLQGALLEAGPLPELGSARRLVAELTNGQAGRCILALDGVEDPQNVGALMRVADAAGAGGMVLTQRRAPPLSPALARASAGASEWLPVARVPNLARALAELKAEGFWIVGADLEAEDGLYELPDRILGGDLVLVLGAEGRGIRPGVRAALDHPLRIPMLGRVASLNVATSGAIVLFELLRRSQRVERKDG